MEMPKLTKRIYQIIELKSNRSVNKFSKKIGISQQKLNRIFNYDKKMRRFPTVSADIIINITILFVDINPEWLLTGKGSMLKNQINKNNKIEIREKGEKIIHDKKIKISENDKNIALNKSYVNNLQYSIELQKKIIDFLETENRNLKEKLNQIK